MILKQGCSQNGAIVTYIKGRLDKSSDLQYVCPFSEWDFSYNQATTS